MRKVVSVVPQNNYVLQIVFDDNITKFFDVRPYLNKGIFSDLSNADYFEKVSIKFDSVAWTNEQDFSPDTLYLLGKNQISL